MTPMRDKIQQQGIDTHIVQQGNFTLVQIVWGAYTGSGFAMYNCTDKDVPGLKYNAQRGIDIARGRAEVDIERQALQGEQERQERLATEEKCNMPFICPPGLELESLAETLGHVL